MKHWVRRYLHSSRKANLNCSASASAQHNLQNSALTLVLLRSNELTPALSLQNRGCQGIFLARKLCGTTTFCNRDTPRKYDAEQYSINIAYMRHQKDNTAMNYWSIPPYAEAHRLGDARKEKRGCNILYCPGLVAHPHNLTRSSRSAARFLRSIPPERDLLCTVQIWRPVHLSMHCSHKRS